MREFFGLLAIFTALFVGFALLVGTPAYFVTRAECHAAYAEYNPEFGFFSGCRIEWQGRMTPVELIREIRIAD